MYRMRSHNKRSKKKVSSAKVEKMTWAHLTASVRLGPPPPNTHTHMHTHTYTEDRFLSQWWSRVLGEAGRACILKQAFLRAHIRT